MTTLLNVACIGILLAGLLFAGRRLSPLRVVWMCAGGAFAAFKASELIRVALREIAHPSLWDFKVFWMVGKICAAGGNIYDVASYAPFGPILNPSNDPEFNTIALKIGMPYPPPAAALFCPLGHLANLQTAMAVWYAVLFVAIALSIVALWRLFLADHGPSGLIVVAGLVLALPGTAMTVGFGQLNFFALLLLALVWRERSAWRPGMWLAPLIVLRPLCLVLAVYFAVRRQWTALAALVLTTAGLFVLSVPVIGVNGLLTYLHHNPTQRYPEIYFKGYESLYRILVTFAGNYDGYFSLPGHPVFVIASLVLLLAAAWVCAVAGGNQRNACLSMLLALGLFLYPNTGAHYSVILLVPLLSFWYEQAKVTANTPALVAFLGLQYALLVYRDGALTTGLVFALDAVVFAVLILRKSRRRAERTLETPLRTRASPHAG